MKKYVLTGGPCSGKTTIINELKKRGYDVLEEIARGFLRGRKNFQFTTEERIFMEESMFQEQLKKENGLEKKKLLFCDRGLADYYAYSEHLLGFVPEKLKKFNVSKRYDGIFILERFPFEQDGFREESSEEEAEETHKKIIEVYENLGYSPVFVPIMPAQERTDFVLDYIQKQLKGGK